MFWLAVLQYNWIRVSSSSVLTSSSYSSCCVLTRSSCVLTSSCCVLTRSSCVLAGCSIIGLESAVAAGPGLLYNAAVKPEFMSSSLVCAGTLLKPAGEPAPI